MLFQKAKYYCNYQYIQSRIVFQEANYYCNYQYIQSRMVFQNLNIIVTIIISNQE